MFENADFIHRYTRDDAIRDGVLIDASAAAREAGQRVLRSEEVDDSAA
jgi:hypothetical protein